MLPSFLIIDKRKYLHEGKTEAPQSFYNCFSLTELFKKNTDIPQSPQTCILYLNVILL